MKSNYPQVSVKQLEHDGAIVAIQDGNHGERHPKVNDYIDDGIPFVMANNIRLGIVDLEACARISEEQARTLRIGFAKVGDVLLSHKGSLGNVAIVTTGDPFLMLTPQVTYYRTDNTKLLNRFLVYAFREPAFQARLRSGSDQGTRPYVGITAQRRLEIIYPPPPVQERIADVLGAYDDLIETNRRRILLLEEAARQVYREWFLRLRFPGHEHTTITQGVPVGWEKTNTLEAVSVLSGGTPKTTVPEYWGGDIPFYTPTDASEYCYALETERTITQAGLKNCNSRLYSTDTVFISARGTVGKLNLALRPMAMSQSCYALIGKGHISQLFLYCALREGIAYLKQHASGAVFDAIIVDTFRLIPFTIPDRRHVRLFEESVSPLFRQVGNLLAQNARLRAARDLLLPRLMSGQIAVSRSPQPTC